MADDTAAEANEDLLDAIEDLEAEVEDLKETIDEHPDAALKARLAAELPKLQDILKAMKAQLAPQVAPR